MCFDRIRGCLLGGAIGDALGAPVEFDSLAEIHRRFGPAGVGELEPAYGRRGAITDDTQMTLFTAEGLVLAARAGALERPAETVRLVHRAYLRWLRTQGEQSTHPSFARTDEGWLLGVSELHAQRAPGSTCLAALRGDRMGRIELPLNQSKGCGGVMRVAPVGLVAGVGDCFRLGCQLAAITHGHPGGYLAAGFLALAVRELLDGATLEVAIGEAQEELRRYPGHEGCSTAVAAALQRVRAGRITPDAVESLGQGWVAEEALAIGLFCALSLPDDFQGALRMAVNHGGDSDSTGSMAGSLLGVHLGAAALPERWVETLELRAEIERAAREMTRTAASASRSPDAPSRGGEL